MVSLVIHLFCLAIIFLTTFQNYLIHMTRPNDFPFQNWPISVSHYNKFRLTANFFRFRCLLVIFHTIIMLVLYDMGLFFNSTICGVTFDSRDYIFKSCFNWKFCFKPQIPLRFLVKTENHWLYMTYNTQKTFQPPNFR